MVSVVVVVARRRAVARCGSYPRGHRDEFGRSIRGVTRNVQAARVLASSPDEHLPYRPEQDAPRAHSRVARSGVQEQPGFARRAPRRSRERAVPPPRHHPHRQRPRQGALRRCVSSECHLLCIRRRCLGEADPSSAPTMRSAPSQPCSPSPALRRFQPNLKTSARTRRSCIPSTHPARPASIARADRVGAAADDRARRADDVATRSDIRRTSRVRHFGWCTEPRGGLDAQMPYRYERNRVCRGNEEVRAGRSMFGSTGTRLNQGCPALVAPTASICSPVG